LHRRLAEVDPTAARRIHPHDRVRIIRALEIYTLTGTPISQWQHQWRSSLGHESFVFIGLRRERDDLRRRIVARTEAMLQLGLEAEVQALLARGYAPTLPPLQSVGYGEIVAYLTGAFDLARAQELIVRHTWRLAKRQMTWFRRLPGVHWISLTEMSEASVRQTVQTILRRAWDAQESPSTRVMMGDQEIHCRCPTLT
jgi:tRNA dimethylallyltransferase